jgi:hypothetical protein
MVNRYHSRVVKVLCFDNDLQLFILLELEVLFVAQVVNGGAQAPFRRHFALRGWFDSR